MRARSSHSYACLDALSQTPRPAKLDEQLGGISRLVAVEGRARSLAAVWVAKANQHRVADRQAGSNITEWMVAAVNTDPKAAAGLLHAGRDLLGNQQLEAAALAGQVSPEHARSIGRALEDLPAGLSEEQKTHATGLLIDSATTMEPPRFWTGPPPDKWSVWINPTTGQPEFRAPSALARTLGCGSDTASTRWANEESGPPQRDRPLFLDP